MAFLLRPGAGGCTNYCKCSPNSPAKIPLTILNCRRLSNHLRPCYILLLLRTPTTIAHSFGCVLAGRTHNDSPVATGTAVTFAHWTRGYQHGNPMTAKLQEREPASASASAAWVRLITQSVPGKPWTAWLGVLGLVVAVFGLLLGVGMQDENSMASHIDTDGTTFTSK